MKKVLITGAAGFIGSHLTERCLADGWQVTGLDNFDDYYDPAIKEGNLRQAAKNDRFQLIRGDIRDRALMKSLLQEQAFDLVVHLAARAGVRPSLENPALYMDVNVQGTLAILDGLRHSPATPLVAASSSSVYGGLRHTPFVEEDDTSKPVSPYAASKKAMEVLCHTYHHLYGLAITCLRFFTVYGPRQRPDMAIAKFSNRMLQGQPIPMFGDGQTQRDYTFIDDIIDGVRRAMENVDGFEIYNLGESRTTRLHELIAQLAKALNVEAVIDRQPPQPGDVPLTCASVEKARRKLGYQPNTEVAEGLRRYAAWRLKQATA
ncbi:MAG: NAD-dependent epimerase/dehydratase family protein [Planctomycetota bacterium]|nr:MAG: NAD-dependent epimerase/dehydratase family protein [Planctomycetota bacterium]